MQAKSPGHCDNTLAPIILISADSCENGLAYSNDLQRALTLVSPLARTIKHLHSSNTLLNALLLPPSLGCQS